MPSDSATRILILTNDDGIDAPGLAALGKAAEGLGHRRVIAPAGPWSGRGHAVTTDGPFRIVGGSDGRFAVEGTPADCVRVGLHHLAPDAEWILAGINAGGNLGADVYHSGTVAAAREAVLHGRPAIALSHYIARGRAIDWDRAARWAAAVLRELLARPWEPGSFWNVNLPHPEPGAADPPIVECPLDPSPLPLRFQVEGDLVRYSGIYQDRARRPSTDVDVCFRGGIAVSRIRLGQPDQAPNLPPGIPPEPGLADEGLRSP
jgi:5'-nucleotidase